MLAGDWNVIPTDDPDDVFSAKAMAHDALMQPESRQAFRRILNFGFTDAIRARYPEGRSTPSGIIPPAAGSATPASASTISCSAPGRRPPPRRRRRQGVSRPRESQRPRADLGRDRRLSLCPDTSSCPGEGRDPAPRFELDPGLRRGAPAPALCPGKGGTQCQRSRWTPAFAREQWSPPVSRRRPGHSAAFALTPCGGA